MTEDEGLPVISDARAQTLAGYWADPRDPDAPLSVLARDGTITAETIAALRHDLRILETASEGSVAQGQLRALLAYALSAGERGPVRGWEGLRDPARFRDPASLGPATVDEGAAEAEPDPYGEPEPQPEPYGEPDAEPERYDSEPEPDPYEPEPEPYQVDETSALDLPFPRDWDER